MPTSTAIPRERLPDAAARDAQGRAAHPHRGLARARADLRAGAAQRRRARLRRASRRCARPTPSPTCRASSTSTTPAPACCCRSSDFYDMALAYFRRAAADNVVHAEIFFDPQTHTARGVPIGTVIDGLRRACERGQARARRHERADPVLPAPPERGRRASTTLEQALPYREQFIGVGLDSSERGHPPEKFARVFARCRELGPAPASRTPARRGRRPTSGARSTC